MKRKKGKNRFGDEHNNIAQYKAFSIASCYMLFINRIE